MSAEPALARPSGRTLHGADVGVGHIQMPGTQAWIAGRSATA